MEDHFGEALVPIFRIRFMEDIFIMHIVLLCISRIIKSATNILHLSYRIIDDCGGFDRGSV